MKYFDELKKSMEWLGSKDDTLFLGQAVEYPGTAMSNTLSEINKCKLLEIPVNEDMQMGMTLGLALNGTVPISIYPRWNFLICGANQLINHLDTYQEMTGHDVHILIRVGKGSDNPLDPGPQHKANFFDAFQMMSKNIKFYNFDLLNITENITNLINSADVIHHLAGVTDVAYTKDEEFKDPNKSKIIQQVAIEGTRNIINFSKKSCRIIFPSTHVLYDGLDIPKQDILEDEEPCPQLTYSKSKYQNEIDLQNSDKDFIILRLGSVYGYSGDATRINIMPNLFPIIIQNNAILTCTNVSNVNFIWRKNDS